MNRKNIIFIASIETAAFLLCCFVFAFVLWASNQTPVSSIKRQQKIIFQYAASSESQEDVSPSAEIKYSSGLFDSGYAVDKKNLESVGMILTQGNMNTPQEKKVKKTLSIEKVDPSCLPVGYTEVNYPYLDYPLYVFLDRNGATQYRIYVKKTEDGIEAEGFIPVEQKMKNMKMTVQYDENAAYIDPEQEPYGTIELVDATDEETNGLIKEFGTIGTYYRTNDKGQKEYFVYGHYPNRENSFFIADNDGKMIPGTLPLTNIWQEDD